VDDTMATVGFALAGAVAHVEEVLGALALVAGRGDPPPALAGLSERARGIYDALQRLEVDVGELGS
jgi:hypothetical protein